MPQLKVGERITVRGYFTTEMNIRGRSLRVLEQTLGYASGRFAQGMALIALDQKPRVDQFDLAGYTQVAEHRWVTPRGLDIPKLKALAAEGFSTQGHDRLVKVVPVIPHDRTLSAEEQYPPGGGVKQWKLTDPMGMSGTVVAVVMGYPDGIVMPADFKPRYSYR